MTVETLYPSAPSARTLEQQYSLRRQSMTTLLLPIYHRAYRWSFLVFGDSDLALEIARETATQVIRFGEDALDLPCFLEWSSLYLARGIEEKAAKRHQEARFKTECSIENRPLSTAALVEDQLRQVPMELRLAIILHIIEGHSLQEIGRLLRRSRAIITMRVDEGLGLLRQRLQKAGLDISSEALCAQLAKFAETKLPMAKPDFNTLFNGAGWR